MTNLKTISMKRLFFLLILIIAFSSCNKEWEGEQFQQTISFKAPINNQDVTPIHIPYQQGSFTYQLPLIVSGSLNNANNFLVHVALAPDTLRIFNFQHFQNRVDLYYKQLLPQFFSIPDTLKIHKGKNEGLLDIKLSLKGIDLVNKWILPLTIVDDPSYNYISNQRRYYNKVLLRIIPFNDYSGEYSATSYKIYLQGNENGPPIVKNKVKTYVVNDSTVFFYAGNIDEDRADRAKYKIVATFDSKRNQVTLTADNPFMRFKVNKEIHYSVEEVKDEVRPYLVHRYVKIDNIDYNFSDYTSIPNGSISYTVKGSLIMERKINTQIPDRDQAILW